MLRQAAPLKSSPVEAPVRQLFSHHACRNGRRSVSNHHYQLSRGVLGDLEVLPRLLSLWHPCSRRASRNLPRTRWPRALLARERSLRRLLGL